MLELHGDIKYLQQKGAKLTYLEREKILKKYNRNPNYDIIEKECYRVIRNSIRERFEKRRILNQRKEEFEKNLVEWYRSQKK